MNCRDARIEIALRVGNDEVGSCRWQEVRRHAANCPGCRAHYQQMKQALKTLEQADPPSTYETRDSLWPELATRLDAGSRPSPPGRPQRWIPYVSFLAACLLFVVVWITVPGPPSHPVNPHIPRGVGGLPEWSTRSPAPAPSEGRQTPVPDDPLLEFPDDRL